MAFCATIIALFVVVAEIVAEVVVELCVLELFQGELVLQLENGIFVLY